MKLAELVNSLIGTAYELILREIAFDDERAQRRKIIHNTGIGHSTVDHRLENLVIQELIKKVNGTPVTYCLTNQGIHVLSLIFGQIHRNAHELKLVPLERVFPIQLGKTKAEDLLALPQGTLITIDRFSSNVLARQDQIKSLQRLMLAVSRLDDENPLKHPPEIYYLGDIMEFGILTLGDFIPLPYVQTCMPDEVPKLLDKLEKEYGPYEKQKTPIGV